MLNSIINTTTNLSLTRFCVGWFGLEVGKKEDSHLFEYEKNILQGHNVMCIRGKCGISITSYETFMPN